MKIYFSRDRKPTDKGILAFCSGTCTLRNRSFVTKSRSPCDLYRNILKPAFCSGSACSCCHQRSPVLILYPNCCPINKVSAWKLARSLKTEYQKRKIFARGGDTIIKLSECAHYSSSSPGPSSRKKIQLSPNKVTR